MSQVDEPLPIRELSSIFGLDRAFTALVILNRPVPRRLLRLLWDQGLFVPPPILTSSQTQKTLEQLTWHVILEWRP